MYYRVLAKAAMRLRGPAYWHYHRVGLKALNETINWPSLVLHTGLISLWLALNPGMTAIQVLRSRKGIKPISLLSSSISHRKRCN